MKKILEVLQYGENDIRFKTDLEVEKNPEMVLELTTKFKNPEMVLELTTKFAWAMFTTLWGGNERTVLAMIRSLAIADLAVSVNRKEMLGFLDESSEMLVRSFQEAKEKMEQQGVKITTFAPGVQPPKMRS